MKLFLSLTASVLRMHRADLRAKRSPQERPRAAEIWTKASNYERSYQKSGAGLFWELRPGVHHDKGAFWTGKELNRTWRDWCRPEHTSQSAV